MGRGKGQVKVIKKSAGNQNDVGNMFNQLLGDEKSLELDIIKDKYNKLESDIRSVYKLLSSFRESIYKKVLHSIPNIDLYISEIDGFIEDCKAIIPEDIPDDKLIKHYLSIKENKVIKDCIHICKNLIQYKKFIEDNENLNDNFLKSSKTKELIIFPFSSFDLKYIYNNFIKIDESIKKYILIFLNMLYNATYDIYQIITSPDIDINKFSEIIIQSISQAKKMIPRANKAFKKIEESIDLLQNNFSSYYKDFVTSRSPTVIIENFILDCSKDVGDSVDLELARQFKTIAMFYKRKNGGKIKDPRVNQIFDMLDQNFSMLNINDDDIKEDDDFKDDVEEIKVDN